MANTLILFGPGYGDSHILIDQLAKKFTDADTLVLNYPARGMFKGITAMARGLLPIVEALNESYDNMVFVGHSMGGLVGREIYRLGVDNGVALFDHYVSIATPHKGTGLAALGSRLPIERISASARDMMPESKFMACIAESIVPLNTMTIQAQWDLLLYPSITAQLEGFTNHIIPWTGHITVVTAPATFRLIRDWISPIRYY